MDWLEIKEFLKDTAKYIIFIFVVLFIAVYVVGLQQVVGDSMAPTFNNGNILILDKLSYRFKDIQRGDIVALFYDDTKYLIKRVIGLPGERVDFRGSDLYINNRLVTEDYLDENVVTEDFSLTTLGYHVIPENMYFVVGDNRGDSLDSRDAEVGLIPKEDMIGKVRIRLWPINKIGFIK